MSKSSSTSVAAAKIEQQFSTTSDVRVTDLADLSSLLKIDSVTHPIDAVPKLFDMSAYTCLMKGDFMRAVVDFVTELGGPLIAVYGTSTRVCVDPLNTSGEHRQQLASRHKWVNEVVSKLHPGTKTAGFRGEWAILVDELSQRYLTRVKEQPALKAVQAETKAATTATKFADDDKRPGFFFARFSAWLNTKNGRDAVQQHMTTAGSKRQPFAYRRMGSAWEWNARLLSDALFPLALDSNMLAAHEKEDLVKASAFVNQVLAREDKKRNAATSSGGEYDRNTLPPLPVLFGVPYVEETGELAAHAPVTSRLLQYLRERRFPRFLTQLQDTEFEENNEEEEEEKDDDQSVESTSSQESVAKMGIAQPKVKTVDNDDGGGYSSDAHGGQERGMMRPNSMLDGLMFQYFDLFPHLQMDCRVVSTLSKDGQGLGSYIFDAHQMLELCNSIKATHYLGRYDAACDAAHKRWLFTSWKEKSDSPAPPAPPPRTHPRQTLFTLAQELAAMVTRMEETDSRLRRFDGQYVKKSGRGDHGAWPAPTMYCAPWFEHATRVIRDGQTERVKSDGVGDYYRAWKANGTDGERKTKKWARFLSAAKSKLWELLQSGDYVPYGSLDESDPELALLLALHKNQHVWNTPLQSHAAVFKIDAWMGIPAVTTGHLVSRLNEVVHTAVYRAHEHRLKMREDRCPTAECWKAARATSPINLCYPLLSDWLPTQPYALHLDSSTVLNPSSVVRRLKEVVASSVALLGAVYKFLLYVSTIAHKILLCECARALPVGSLRDYFARIVYGLDTSVVALNQAIGGEHRSAYGIEFVPDHAVYGYGEFGPTVERALKKDPSRKRAFVETVDPIRLFQEIAKAEGRTRASTQSWNRLVILQRFPDPADDRSGNEAVAMTTHFMEDLLNTAAFRMTADGWRMHHHGKGSAMKTPADRAQRRRMPLSICSTLEALVSCVRACVSTTLHNHFTKEMDATKRSLTRKDEDAPMATLTEFRTHVWMERTDQAVTLARTMFKTQSIPRVRSHVFAATKAWWAMGLMMCTTDTGSPSTIRAFTATRNVIKECISRCARAHTLS